SWSRRATAYQQPSVCGALETRGTRDPRHGASGCQAAAGLYRGYRTVSPGARTSTIGGERARHREHSRQLSRFRWLKPAITSSECTATRPPQHRRERSRKDFSTHALSSETSNSYRTASTSTL